MADDIPFQKIEGGWAGLLLAKIRLILANDLVSKKKGHVDGLVLAKIRLIDFAT